MESLFNLESNSLKLSNDLENYGVNILGTSLMQLTDQKIEKGSKVKW